MIEFSWNLIKKTSFIVFLFFGGLSFADTYVRDDGSFVDSQDRKLVEFQLNKFVSECIFIGSAEAKNIERMDSIFSNEKKNLKKKPVGLLR